MTNKVKTEALQIILVGLVVAIAYVGGTVGHARTITHTRTVTRSPYTHPSQTIDGAQINSQLAGYTCSYYAQQKTLVCAP